MDKMQNFVVGDIVTAPSPASSGTSVTVNNGSYFPDPSTFGDYNLVMWDRLSGEIPTTSNCEIVRVTAKTTDDDNAILTITRAQEGTTAKELGANWRAYMSVTKKYFDDLKTYIDGLQITKASGSDINTGANDSKFVTSKAIKDSYLSNVYTGIERQAIINGGFTVNQRGYVSNATLAAGAYGHDRWKAGASGGDYTFTQLPQSTQITIKSGKSLIQVIEDKNVIGGHYTLSWEGTAQARFGIDSATPSGDYAASPITITTQTAGTVMSVEFNEGTLGKVVLNSGDVALPFMPKSYEEELRACQRYCQVITSAQVVEVIGFGTASSTTIAQILLSLKSSMRISPTLTATAGDFQLYDGSSSSITITTIKKSSINTSGEELFALEAIVASGLTQFRSYFLIIPTAGKSLILEAEL